MNISKKRYLQGFAFFVVMLGILRAVFPQLAQDKNITAPLLATYNADTVLLKSPNKHVEPRQQLDKSQLSKPSPRPSKFFNADGTMVKNRIFSVQSFAKAFPDQNDVQLASAKKWGVSPVFDREEAEHRKAELVFIGANPYYSLDKLNNSIPYLVPVAANLLQDIGKIFFDSLQMKGIPLHKIIVTSVLRTKKDIQKLRGYNANATENSCHQYGTTVDISYNRYETVSNPTGQSRRAVRNDSLKWVLSEVLNDMRKQNRCYIKYEVKQGCFHLTVK